MFLKLPVMTLTLSLLAFLLFALHWPVLRLSGIHDGPLPHWSTYVWQLTFFVLLDDFLYYWMHRLMHENKWLELAMTAGVALVGPVLLESHITVVYAWIILRQLEAADDHTGYNLPWDPLHWLPLYEGAA